MMLRKLYLPRFEMFLRNAILSKTGLPYWSLQSKDFFGRSIVLRRLASKDRNDDEDRESKVKEYLKKEPSMQQKGQEQIKELRDLRIELIKERKILQKRLKENEKKIRHEKRRSTSKENKPFSKYFYKLKLTKATPKVKRVPIVRQAKHNFMEFEEFIQNFGKPLPDDESSTNSEKIEYTTFVETTGQSKDQTPPNQGKNLNFESKETIQKSSVGFAQEVFGVHGNNQSSNQTTVGDASKKSSKGTPPAKSNSKVESKHTGVNFKGSVRSQDVVKPDEVISTVTKKDQKSPTVEKAKNIRNIQIKREKAKKETAASKSTEKKVSVPTQPKAEEKKETVRRNPLSIALELGSKIKNAAISSEKDQVEVTKKNVSAESAETSETNEKSTAITAQKKRSMKLRVPMPSRPYDVLTQARKLKRKKKLEEAKKASQEKEKSPYAQQGRKDPKAQFQEYVKQIQQQQKPLKTSSNDKKVEEKPSPVSQSKLDVDKGFAAREQNPDLATLTSSPIKVIDNKTILRKRNIPPKILEQLKYAQVRNQKFLVKQLEADLIRELEDANNRIKHKNNEIEAPIKGSVQKSILGERGSKLESIKVPTVASVNEIEASAKMFLRSLQQFVHSLKLDENKKNEKK